MTQIGSDRIPGCDDTIVAWPLSCYTPLHPKLDRVSNVATAG
jgi:hypothetical protein